VLSGVGGAEMAVVGDLWKASRGQIPLEQVIANHGFHGPGEGEVSSVVWREDPSPLRRVLEYYRELPDSEAVEAKERDKEARRVTMTRELLAAVPPWRRPAAALVLKLARDRIPDRGRGKRSFLQGIDITRMAARRAGEHLATAGLLEDRDDVFYLTEHELLAPLPGDVKELVAMRRERRELYQRITFPETTWAGMPAAEFAEAAPLEGEEGEPVINGTGASAGIAEGRVRVVTDPAFTEVEPGEILVAPTTDPSWCSIMFVSAALVVDLGGMLSHAAVVARELGIPCVVNAGTRRRG
jgi:pyruvate,water dikinase